MKSIVYYVRWIKTLSYFRDITGMHVNHWLQWLWVNEFKIMKVIWLLNLYEFAQLVSDQTPRRHTNTHRRTRRRSDGRRNKLTDEETEGRKEGGMEGGQITEGEDIGVKKWKEGKETEWEGEREQEKERNGGGEMAKRNHAWFTFDLSKGHGLPCGAGARVRPLWAEQWVLIVLLVGVVGVVLGHGNWDGGGEELAPLPRILEAAERPRLLLIPYIYKQDRHKEKNCREIWTHGLREREEVEEGKGKGRKMNKERKWRRHQRMPIEILNNKY